MKNTILAFTLISLVACNHAGNPLENDTIVSEGKVITVVDHWKTQAFTCNEQERNEGRCEYYNLELSNGWIISGIGFWVYDLCGIGSVYPNCTRSLLTVDN